MTRLVVGFTGDVSFSGFFSSKDWNTEFVDPALLGFLDSCDHVVANLEGPLTWRKSLESRGGTRLVSHPCHLTTLEKLGCTVLNLANNHVLDAGTVGLKETIQTAKQAGMLWFGAGDCLTGACSPIVVSSSGVSAALMAFTVDIGQGATQEEAGTCSGLSFRQYRRMIQEAKRKADWVVVQYHGGDEFVPLPGRDQIRMLRRLADWGADVVICHHAHVVRPFERYRGSLIFYGLGNLFFDILGHQGYLGTTDSVIVRLCLTKTETGFDFVRTRIDRESHQVGVVGTDEFLRELDLSDYRFEYGRAVYDALYWPLVPRGSSGAPSSRDLMAQRSSFVRKFSRTAWWKRNIRAALNPVERMRMLAMVEYRLRLRWRSRVNTTEKTRHQ